MISTGSLVPIFITRLIKTPIAIPGAIQWNGGSLARLLLIAVLGLQYTICRLIGRDAKDCLFEYSFNDSRFLDSRLELVLLIFFFYSNCVVIILF